MFVGQDSRRSEVVFARNAIGQPADFVLRLALYTDYQVRRTQREKYAKLVQNQKLKKLQDQCKRTSVSAFILSFNS